MALPLVTYLVGFPLDFPESRFFDSALGVIQPATTTKFVVETPEGIRTVFKGEFTVSGGIVTGGTVTGYVTFVGHTKMLKASGFALDALAVVAALDAVRQSDDFDQFRALFGSDSETARKFVGSAHGDEFGAWGEGSIGLGKGGDDDVVGGAGSQTLKGGQGDDVLSGDIAADVGSKDFLYGGKGHDIFFFRATGTPFDYGPPDAIKDFSAKNDVVQVDVAGGDAGVGPGFLDDEQFHIGKAAKTAEQVIIYDKKTGALFYDADGSGAAAQVQFAKLSKGLALEADNFYGYANL